MSNHVFIKCNVHILTPTVTVRCLNVSVTCPNPVPIRFGQITIRTRELSPNVSSVISDDIDNITKWVKKCCCQPLNHIGLPLHTCGLGRGSLVLIKILGAT